MAWSTNLSGKNILKILNNSYSKISLDNMHNDYTQIISLQMLINIYSHNLLTIIQDNLTKELVFDYSQIIELLTILINKKPLSSLLLDNYIQLNVILNSTPNLPSISSQRNSFDHTKNKLYEWSFDAINYNSWFILHNELRSIIGLNKSIIKSIDNIKFNLTNNNSYLHNIYI